MAIAARTGLGERRGNALDHGVGYTPLGDNFGFSCGMEVVLADGDLVRTGMGVMANSNSWQLSKYGFGLVVDGIFSQSNFGIVTKPGMWLMPAPPAYRSYMFTFPGAAMRAVKGVSASRWASPAAPRWRRWASTR